MNIFETVHLKSGSEGQENCGKESQIFQDLLKVSLNKVYAKLKQIRNPEITFCIDLAMIHDLSLPIK